MIAIKFMAILGKYYPNVEVVCRGEEIYANIERTGGDPMPTEAELIATYSDEVKTLKITELSNSCAREIVSGFTSLALGDLNLYDSDAVDQLNILGSFAATTSDTDNPEGSSTYHAVRAVIDDVIQLKEYRLHTNHQMKKVILDGVAFKLQKLQRFNNLRNDIITNETRTLEDLVAITWATGIPGIVD